MVKVGDELTVYIPVYAEYAIRVNVTDDMLDEEGDVDYELVETEAYEELPGGPGICCIGGGFHKWSLEMEGDGAEVRYVTDSKGDTVSGNPDKKLGW